MGCGGSTEKQSPTNDGAKSSTPNYDRRPKISVRIGEEVKKLDNSNRIIFIFGGPGSRKGRIVDDLKNSYGFKHICTEEILHIELPKKVANAVKLTTVKEVKEFLEDDPTHISAEWILNMVERKIERDGLPGTTYIVDYIPNLKYMLKLETLTAEAGDALAKFEKRFPISFAMNLAVPADKVLKAKQVLCASANAKERMKETGGGGDEQDAGRVQRRAVLYNKVLSGLMDYFMASNRLVTVDVTCGVADLIWHQVHDLLSSKLHFQPTRTVNTVILFAFDDADAADIDYDRFIMEKVSLKDSVDNPNDSVENVLRALSKVIDDQSPKADSFVVLMSGTSVTQQSVEQLSSRILMFEGLGNGHVENYLPGTPKGYEPAPDSTKYKSVYSTENEICLFPKNTADNVCKCIASVMAQARKL